MEFYLAHIGVNPDNEEEAKKMYDLMNFVLKMKQTVETPLSWFIADGKIELMKDVGYGTKGHLAFYTSNLQEAIKLLENHGYHVDLKTAKYNEDGSMRLIYIDQEINGFAIHLTTRK